MAVVFVLSLAVSAGVASLLPGAAAQHHGGAGGLTILHDVRDDGRTFAGNLDHFGVLLRGGDGVPAVHSNVEVEVYWNGAELWSMTPPSGHDYDALWTWAQSFPGPGAYEVRARVPDGDWQVFSGYAHDATDAVPADLVLDVPATAVARSPVKFTASLERDGAVVPHSDIEWRIYDEALHEVFRVQTHIHDAPVTLEYAFPQGGRYAVVAVGFIAFPSADEAPFTQVLEVAEVTVGAGLPDLPAIAVPAGVLPENAVVKATGGGLVLHGTYDPYTSIGIGQPIRFGVIVTDEAGNILPHVDLRATITGPSGTVFESSSLHEYDGVAEIVTTHHDLGMHLLTVTASRGGEAVIEMPYEVRLIPNAVAVGPASVTVTGPDAAQACVAADYIVTAEDIFGQPYQHAEVGLLVVDTDAEAIVLATKLHTHAAGTYPFRLAAAGDVVMLATAAGTTPDLAGPGLLEFAAWGDVFTPVGGTCPAAADAGPGAAAALGTPWPGVLVGLGLAGAAWLRRDRRGPGHA